MDVQTWASVATILATGIALATVLSRRIDQVETRLGTRIDDLDDKLSTRIDDLDTRLSTRVNDLDTRLSTRIDDLSTRMDDMRSDQADIRAGVRALEQRFFEILLPYRPVPTGTDDA